MAPRWSLPQPQLNRGGTTRRTAVSSDTCCADQRSNAIGHRHRSGTTQDESNHGGRDPGSAKARTHRAGYREREEHCDEVTGTRSSAGGNRMARMGKLDPTVKAAADEAAACHGLVSASGLMPSSASACAAKASRAVSPSASCLDARSLGDVGGGKLIEFVGGGFFEFAVLLGQQGAFGITLAADREVHSERMDTAPATKPAMPVVMMEPRAVVAPATPTTSRRHDAVVRAEDTGPQPVGAASRSRPVRLGRGQRLTTTGHFECATR